jgi:5'-nucleotidase
MCDIILEAVNADCVLINSGTFRSDALHPKGEFKVRDLKSILPFLDTILVLACTGKS